jgi:probable phosphoglycerate mutase
VTTDILLVRHGESESNVEGRLCGVPPGPGLTAHGRRQAAAVARQLLGRGVRPGRIVASPLQRALETAQPFARATGLHIEVADELREVTFGAWEGLRVAQLAAEPDFRAWCLDPERCPPPAGERLSDVGLRVGRLVRRLAALGAPGAVVGFSHMHPLIGAMLEGRGRDFAGEMAVVPNAAIVHLQVENGVLRFVSLDPTASGVGDAPAVAL